MPVTGVRKGRPTITTEAIENHDPRGEYLRRLDARKRLLATLSRQDGVVANVRLVVFVAGVAIAWLAFWPPSVHWAWLSIPVAAFVALVIMHERIKQGLSRARNAVEYYERGIARVEDRWMGAGREGLDLMPKEHPYAGDLDIFGPGSLYQLLCTAQTAAGRKMLAEWLCVPARPDEIRARQTAIEELRGRIDLREDLAYAGRTLEASVSVEDIAEWTSPPPVWWFRWLPALAYAVSIAALYSCILAILGGPLFPLSAGIAVLGILHGLTRRRVRQIDSAGEKPGFELEVVGRVLARLEREHFSNPYLQTVQIAFGGGQSASAAILRLRQLQRMREASRNLIFAPLAAVLMWDFHLARAIDAWRVRHRYAIGQWLEAVGRLEVLCALATYAYEHPQDPFPKIVDGAAVIEGQDLGHPLLPAAHFVRNDVTLDSERRLLIVSGSNMSGKTALLRTVGINVVLAMAGAPVRARTLVLSPLMAGATIDIHDSIHEGVSRFYAEIKRIRTLMDITQGPAPLLFLLDEIFHGTNSYDRRIGARAVLRELLHAGAIGLVTTHDLAITALVDELNGPAANVHFADHLEGSRLAFDYRLNPGVVQRSNALDLMRAIGLHIE